VQPWTALPGLLMSRQQALAQTLALALVQACTPPPRLPPPALLLVVLLLMELMLLVVVVLPVAAGSGRLSWSS
jgi:hypothetical protein